MSSPAQRICLITLLAALAMVGSPASSEEIQIPDLRFENARERMLAGDLDGAISTIDLLREEFPENVDYVVLRAQVLSRQGRDREALEDLRTASRLAPDYEYVWQLRYSILDRQDHESSKPERSNVRREAAARFPEARWWRDDPVPQATWSILAGVGYDNLSTSAPDWNDQFVELQRESANRHLYRARLGRNERFDNPDWSLEIGTEFQPGPNSFAGLDLGTANDPEFSPELSFGGHIGRSLGDGWVVDLRYRHRGYETVTVDTVIGTVEKYLGQIRLAYSLGLSSLDGSSNSASHVFTFNWYSSDIASYGLSLSTGSEAESVGPGQVLETDIRGISISGRREVSERVDLQWWLGLHDQGDLYRRQYVGMAVSIRL